jgi:hypothetical protein
MSNSNLNSNQSNAMSQSLDEDPFLTTFSRNQNARREDLNEKMADREMVSQRGANPFLQTNYVNDIVASDAFLKPQNTTFERAKENSKEENK